MAKKTIWLWGAGLLIGLYATFVLQQLWNWFLVPTINASPISFWAMYGLHLFVVLLTKHLDHGWENDFRWEGATKLLEAFVPDERRETLLALSKKQTEEVWMMAGAMCFSNAVGYSITLVTGWVVHTVLM